MGKESSAERDRPVMDEGLWTAPEAAKFLSVSVGYLRESSCPKILLPSNGRGARELVRYDPKDVRAWALSRRVA